MLGKLRKERIALGALSYCRCRTDHVAGKIDGQHSNAVTAVTLLNFNSRCFVSEHNGEISAKPAPVTRGEQTAPY